LAKLYLTQFPRYSVANSIENHHTPVFSNFGIKLGEQRARALGNILAKTAWSYL